MTGAPIIALTVDVEDRHHGLRIASTDTHIREDIGWILDELATADVRATFFVLGQIARSDPSLIKRISAAGHEIGLHGVTHEFMHEIGPARFKRGLGELVPLLSDLTGQPIRGFRAPFFSVTQDTQWCLELLAGHGFKYDASVYPGPNDRYGWRNAPGIPVIHQPTGLQLFPVPMLQRRIPIAFSGGAYLRMLPAFLVDWGFRQQVKAQKPGMIYIHPWETAPSLAWERRASIRANMTRHLLRRRLRPQLQRLVKKMGPEMGSMYDVLNGLGELPMWAGAANQP